MEEEAEVAEEEEEEEEEDARMLGDGLSSTVMETVCPRPEQATEIPLLEWPQERMQLLEGR